MPIRESGDQKYYDLLTRIPRSVTEESAKDYRDSDSRMDDPAHTDVGNALTRICRSLNRPLSVLDLGCGCGRHFRFLKGSEKIVGVDVSQEMLKQAKHPAGEEMIHANIDLVCGDFFAMEFPDQSFDVIYSAGVFGLWVPLDDYILRKIRRWLKPDGVALLVVVDAKTPVAETLKSRLACTLRRFMPASMRRRLDARPGSRFLKLYESEMRQLLTDAGLSFTIWHRGDPKRRVDLVCELMKNSTYSYSASIAGSSDI